MKPLTDLFEEIACLKNLFQAAKATLARGRRFYGDGAAFKFQLEREVFRLHEQLMNGTYRHGRYEIFEIRDPKPRTIAAANFRDRVLHHAVHDVIEPKVDRIFIHDSYACRKDKGTHKALDRAQSFIRANAYVVHLDVKSYFQNINHDILRALLRRIIGDVRVNRLLDGIIESTHYLALNAYANAGNRRISSMIGDNEQLSLFDWSGVGVKGLPLGNLTSQFFANLYLNELDQYVKHRLKVRCYVRYMDDMLAFANNKTVLHQHEEAIRAFAADRLRLELHPSGGPLPTERGLSFLGFRLYPAYRKLRAASVRRFVRRMNGLTDIFSSSSLRQVERHELMEKIRQSVQSFNAHALCGNTFGIRRVLYERYPIINSCGFAKA